LKSIGTCFIVFGKFLLGNVKAGMFGIQILLNSILARALLRTSLGKLIAVSQNH